MRGASYPNIQPHRQRSGYGIQRWARRQFTGSLAAKAVLLALATYADADGRCWPAVATLADDIGRSVRTVQGALRHLEHLGLIQTAARVRPGGSQSSNLYVLNPQNVDKCVDEAEAQSAPGGAQPVAPLELPPRTKPSPPAPHAHAAASRDEEEVPMDDEKCTVTSLDLGLFELAPEPVDPRPRMVQQLVAAYVRNAPGVVTTTLRRQVGAQIKRLVHDDIDPELLMQAVIQAANQGRRDFDRFLAAPSHGSYSRANERAQVRAQWSQHALAAEGMSGREYLKRMGY